MDNNEQNTQKRREDCSCGGHSFSCGNGRRRHRMLAAIIGTILIFWIGFKLGEMKGFIHALYGGMGMHGNGHMMMREWGSEGGRTYQGSTSAPVAPATVVPTSVAPTVQ